jgi:hypothetical protein
VAAKVATALFVAPADRHGGGVPPKRWGRAKGRVVPILRREAAEFAGRQNGN